MGTGGRGSPLGPGRVAPAEESAAAWRGVPPAGTTHRAGDKRRQTVSTHAWARPAGWGASIVKASPGQTPAALGPDLGGPGGWPGVTWRSAHACVHSRDGGTPANTRKRVQVTRRNPHSRPQAKTAREGDGADFRSDPGTVHALPRVPWRAQDLVDGGPTAPSAGQQARVGDKTGAHVPVSRGR